MKPNQSLPKLTARLLVKLETYFKHRRPDLVLAHGDTTTCFAAALSSFYQHIPFFHVEAGLRSHKLSSPFPEEFNRQSVAPLARHHFAPTSIEKENLIKDGVHSHSITITGSTIHDAIQLMKNKTQPLVLGPNQATQKIVVVTLHRRESNQSIIQTLSGIKCTALHRPDILFVCPVHPNPSVQTAFHHLLDGQKNIFLIDPLPYPKFISLLMQAQHILTDSGGVQEEAAYLGKKVLLARRETERRDGLANGTACLIGLSAASTEQSIQRALNTTNDLPVNQNITSASATIAEFVERNVR